MDTDQKLREQLSKCLSWRGAHVTFEEAVEGIPAEMRGQQPPNLPHSPWQLVEHLRLAQHDILDFCRDPGYVEPTWPDDYWPADAAPPTEAAWVNSIHSFQADLQAMIQLVGDPDTDLFAPIPHGNGQTILREALLIIDHNAYHVGQLVDVRRLLGLWP